MARTKQTIRKKVPRRQLAPDLPSMNRGKRLKTTPCPNELSITDLPTDQLAAVSEYLGKTSSVLFAVALTAPVRSWRTSKREHGPNKVSRAVIKAAARPAVPPSTESVTAAPWCSPYTQRTHLEEYYNSSNCWELLDFCDIHDVATRLEDVDVRAMLVCIDAKRCLKKLRLPVCQSLRGYGLEELWGSTILEHVDFSHIYPTGTRDYTGRRALCTFNVSRVLLSIINTDGHSLRKVVLPYDWRTKERMSKSLKGFLEAFDVMIKQEEVQCEHCEEMCRAQGNSRSCQVCFKRICEECHAADTEDPFCERFALSCDDCGLILCQSCGDHTACEECGVSFCGLCKNREGSNHDVAECCVSGSCFDGPMCMKCRKSDMDDTQCWGCRDMVYPTAIEEKNVAIAEKISAAEENERLAKEIAENDSAIDRLVEENMQLRQRLAEQEQGGSCIVS